MSYCTEKRVSKSIPSEREMDLLKVMWRLGEAKVRDIHQALCPDGECAFTTVQTLVRIMCKKGLVKKRSRGRIDFYTPVYTEQNATSRFLNKVFDGAVDKFVLSLLKAEDVSSGELETLETMIADARKSKQQEESQE